MWIALFFSLILTAQAEYRAYELALVNKEAGSELKIISTLDHIQYRGYYQVLPTEQLYCVDSWMCWGRTSDFKEICPKPIRTPAAATPATESSPDTTP